MAVQRIAGNNTAIGKAWSAARCGYRVQDNSLQNGARECSQIKERTGKGSAGPFGEVRSKGTFEPQYENGVRGNTIFDSVDPNGSNSNFLRDLSRSP